MLKVYTSGSCASCRKVKEWLKEHSIAFVERIITAGYLNETELKDILSKSENGAEDIISKRSKVIKDKKVDVDNMTIKELVNFIRENPTVLKRPIIVNDRLIQVGYNKEEIRTFIPREVKAMINDNCGPQCPNYSTCCGSDLKGEKK